MVPMPTSSLPQVSMALPFPPAVLAGDPLPLHSQHPPALLHWVARPVCLPPALSLSALAAVPPQHSREKGLVVRFTGLSSRQPQLCAPGRRGSPSPLTLACSRGETVRMLGGRVPGTRPGSSTRSPLCQLISQRLEGQSGGPDVSQEVVGTFSVRKDMHVKTHSKPF